MKFIHAADLHLDSPFLGLTNLPNTVLSTVRQATFTAATKVFDRALTDQVDFVLLAGDLFDRAEQSVAAQAYLFHQFERLNQAKIPVIISFGNHDFAADQHQSVAYPDNVTILGAMGTTKTLTLQSGETVAVSGFSYPERWVTQDPVATFPDRSAADWQIGLLHGALATGSDDHYAPFKLSELLAKRYDYWALGHIHHRQLLNEQPPVLYAGNTQGRSVNETGVKGAYLVSSQAGKLVPSFFPTSAVLWENLTVVFDHVTDLKALGLALTTWLEAHVTSQLTLTALTVTLAQPLDAVELAQITSGDWLSLYLRTHQRYLVAANRTLIKLQVSQAATKITAPQIDQQYWERGQAQVFESANERATFGKLLQDTSLAEWFMQPTTTVQLKQQAEQELTKLMGGEDNHAT
ncbi:DNA repair exonuclease [Levilactobacillus senmaizukei DSM 21775 = NBRC 103853]|uniref:DNA repair exonuclease n=1 Tax=Levilactobacillus senmaizukei DSM 21775 = NBRC 103853 TaxID=1423803 RepID=A0A0R2DP98_9LACO|nr:DNA repair exonuclease [Levilactobacillus senmaizukei]KRN02108.1 DNA repair exonuclease [Levilactobacillus senmaizukei DSM 21775 = NBRC 103853]